ncbi:MULTISPECIES: hypothetical protein [unclassified Acinetobacter]|uniref:hypothetical protein n=1 Tax=unclassified Acinetobacter TaxID=196816 RepID=UPI0015D2E7C3|nr:MULTISPECIES: hypothetical protein [unclassified Acinetobacter]UUS59988.1 hypothetical protein MST17_11500 [Acinetobacter sp. YH16056_T]
MKKTLICLALAGLLSACGGSDNDSGSNQNPPPSSATQIGVLTDGPVTGVKYLRASSSGESIEGITNDKGEFEYAEGDTVRFFIGDVQLGEAIEAKARITPLDLAESENARTNLMVFLQSLDSDGDHSNGIEISAETQAAFNTVNLTFEQNSTDFTTEVLSKTTLTVDQLVTPEKAAENFQATFYKDIAGTWEIGRTESTAVILHILPDGRYALGEADVADETGKSGIETGRLNWNALTSALSPVISVDTNGDYGLSHPDNDGHYRLSYNGTDLVLTDVGSNSTYILTKVKQSSGLVGTWQFNQTHLFAFFDTGFYFLLDTEGDDDCANPGIEYGKYSMTANTLAATEVLYDTNDCGGLQDSWDGSKVNATYSISGTSLTLHPQGEDSVTLQRSN